MNVFADLASHDVDLAIGLFAQVLEIGADQVAARANLHFEKVALEIVILGQEIKGILGVIDLACRRWQNVFSCKDEIDDTRNNQCKPERCNVEQVEAGNRCMSGRKIFIRRINQVI